MARSGDISLIAAIGISLLLHVAVLSTGWYGYLRHGVVTVTRSAPAEPEELIVPVPPSFGDSDGTGESLNALDGRLPMQAREAPQDQAFLRRQEGVRPSEASLPAEPARQPGEPRNPPDPPADRQPPFPELPQLAAIEPARFGLATPIAPPPPRPNSRPPDDSSAQSPPTPPSAAAADGGPLSASESDPFRAENPEIRFERGQVVVRFGRQVRTTRPRLSLSAAHDLRRLRFPTVVMRVETDAGGNVIYADIHRSSGSGEIDLACRIAMLDWWIEPPTDPNDQPIPDVMYWRLSWR